MTAKFAHSFSLAILAAALTAGLGACATTQENPNYQYSTKYKGHSPYTTVASNTTTHVETTPVSYQAAPISYHPATSTSPATYTRVNHECLTQETNRQLIGGAIGGSVGAIAGKKLIGGTKGTIIGAVTGGAAGYGIGDKSINCDPVEVAVTQPAPVIASTYSPHATQYGSPQYGASQGQVIAASSQTYSTTPTSVHPAAPTDMAYGDTTGTPGYDAMMAQNAVAPVGMTPSVGAGYSSMPHTAHMNTASASSHTVPAPRPVVMDVNAVGDMASMPTSSPLTMPSLGAHTVVQGDTVYSLSRKLCVSIEDIQRRNNLGADFGISIGQVLTLPSSQC